MKKFKLLILAMALITALCGCGSSANTPEGVTETFLKSLKSYDEAAFADLSYGGSIVNKGENASDATGIELFKAIVSKMDYEVGESTVDGDSATVKVHIDNVDMNTIMQQYMMTALSNFSQGTTSSDEQQLDDIKAGIDKADSSSFSKDIEVQLKKTDGEWKVDASESANNDLYNAVTGGLLDFANEMSNSFSLDNN